MPHLRDRLARRLGRLRQPRRAAGRARHLASARAHGVQGHGAPHRAADRRGDRGGRRRSQCRDRRRDHRLLRARAQGRRAARARRPRPTSCPIRRFDPDELAREQNVIVQEIGAAEDTPDDLVFDICRRRPSPASRSAARFSARRRRCARSTPASCAPISRATIARPTWWWRRPARSTTTRVVAEVEQRFGQLRRPGGAGAASRRVRRRRADRAARSRAGAYRARAARACRSATPPLQPAGLHQRAGRRHVLAAVPGGAREARALLRDLRLPLALFRHRHVRPLCRHRCRRCCRADAGRGRRDRRRRRQPSPRRRSPAPRRR